MTKNSQKLSLIVGLHSHLPFYLLKRNVDNDLFKNYLNLIDTITNLQNTKTTVHFSGSLISHLDKKFPDFSQNIRNLLERKQLELLGGGIYEPIFPFIPKEDRQTQILLMNRLLNHTYGYTPFGAWVTESAWEPSLALDLAKSRIEYTCLSKEYFVSAGLDENEICGYYLTEEEGRKVAIFPIMHQLNNIMQLYSPAEAISNLINNSKQLKSEKSLVVLFYEGLVTNSNKLNWIINFLQLIDKNDDLIETHLLSDYFQKNKPTGRIYLGAMQDIKPQNTLGSWKHFLLKYPEANLLHKKMLRISKKINSAKEGKSRFKVIKEMISQAQDLLLKGQSSNTYWENSFGGIYLPQERHNTYSNLIKAENLIDAASRQNSKWIQLSEIDYDCDGNDEIIIETETQNIYISPALGGTVLEHDFRPKNLNLTNTISRKKEKYHYLEDQRTIEPEDKKLEISQNGNLIYDNYLKLNLIDHFLQNSLDLQKCKLNQLPHITREIISPYHVEKIKAKEETCKVTLTHNVNLANIENNPLVELRKQISTRSGDSSLIVDYLLTNKSETKFDFVFAVEFNFSFIPSPDQNSYFYLEGNIENRTINPDLKSSEEIKETSQISIHDKTQGIDLSLSWNKPCNLFRYPVETISYNLENLEKIYQGTTILLTWHLVLEQNIPWELSIKQEIITRAEEL